MRKWYPWLVVVATLVFTAVVYGMLPERVPSHWDLQGNVDGYMGRAQGALLMPVIILAMTLVIPRLPAIDPRRANYTKFRGSYDLVLNALVTVLALLHVAMLGVALGWPVAMETMTPLLIGALFVLLGNVLPRARPNWMFGIRTPWTLSNDRVWERTHRVGGFMFVFAGLMLVLSAFLIPVAILPIVIGVVVVSAFVPLVYSYFAWKQETSRAGNE